MHILHHFPADNRSLKNNSSQVRAMSVSYLKSRRQAIALVLIAAVSCGIVGAVYWQATAPTRRHPVAAKAAVRPPLDAATVRNLRIAAPLDEDLTAAAQQVQPIRIGSNASQALAKASAASAAEKTGPSPISAEPSKVTMAVAPIQLPSWRIGDLQDIAAQDTRLVAWLAVWRTNVETGQPLSKDQLSDLDEILKVTPLSCRTLVDLGNAVSFYAGDGPTAAFFNAAAYQGEKELAALPPGDFTLAKPILTTLIGTLGVQWRLIDDQHDCRYVDAVKIVNDECVKWIPPDDHALASRRCLGEIGSAECLYLLGHVDDAIRAANAIQVPSDDAQLKAGVAWIKGLAFSRAGRFSEADVELQAAVGCAGFKYANDGYRILVIARARRGDVNGANAAFDQWIRRVHPTAEQAAPLASLIDAAASHPASNDQSGG
jgi:hypothetical protein